MSKLSLIYSDLYRYTGVKKYSLLLKNVLINPGFRYMYIHRNCSYYKNNNYKIRYGISRLLLNKYRIKYGYEISSQALIGKGFYIGHLGPIVINPETVIGNNVNVTNGVTIGQQNRGEKKGSPNIGNNVWVGANSIIVGKITVGDNVLIAPGAYVNFDIPNDSIVIGNPAIIKNSIEATNRYIQYKC